MRDSNLEEWALREFRRRNQIPNPDPPLWLVPLLLFVAFLVVLFNLLWG